MPSASPSSGFLQGHFSPFHSFGARHAARSPQLRLPYQLLPARVATCGTAALSLLPLLPGKRWTVCPASAHPSATHHRGRGPTEATWERHRRGHDGFDRRRFRRANGSRSGLDVRRRPQVWPSWQAGQHRGRLGCILWIRHMSDLKLAREERRPNFPRKRGPRIRMESRLRRTSRCYEGR